MKITLIKPSNKSCGVDDISFAIFQCTDVLDLQIICVPRHITSFLLINTVLGFLFFFKSRVNPIITQIISRIKKRSWHLTYIEQQGNARSPNQPFPNTFYTTWHIENYILYIGFS